MIVRRSANHFSFILWISMLLIVAACQQTNVQADTNEATSNPNFASKTETPSGADIVTPTANTTPSSTPQVEAGDPNNANRDATDWKNWPVIPATVSPQMRRIYRLGLSQGNNPGAFSILGDCHSLPDVFMGIYDRDPDIIPPFESALRETVSHFSGSFDRYSPTVVKGTTEGALLWAQWNENKEGYCNPGELPIDCELRHHRPIIAFVHIGTHWEARNEQYLRRIIEKLLDNGTVPIIVLKADNRELDERVNENYARLAIEYDLPVWNFWASVQDLPDHGLSGENDMSLSDAAYDIHRKDGLRVLDFVYNALIE